MTKFSFVLLLVFAVSTAFPQQVIPCYTDEHQQEFLENHPHLREAYKEAQNRIFSEAEKRNAGLSKKSQQGVVHTIPVVFHVIYQSAYDNISRAQIMDALRVLNQDFRRLNPDASATRPIFRNRAADIEVEFALAKLAPDGTCTDGITRTQSPLSVQSDPRDKVKQLVRWDPNKYLNVWVVNSIKASSGTGLTLGYANFPWMPPSKDGVVIRHDAVGQIGTAVYGGRTLTHEVGHYLGLLHPFQGGCSQGDGVGDTPPVASASFGCNLNRNSCNNDSPDLPDMIENYMDYADDICQNAFTIGQKSVMRSVLSNEPTRNNLWKASNLTATGVSNAPCKPIAGFTAIKPYTCTGGSITFIDDSQEGAPDTYSWSFQSGTPATSTQREPVVTYTHAGTYDVSLTVTNAQGTSTVLYKDFAEVKPYYSGNLAQWSEGFESGVLDTPEVSVVSISDDEEFRVTDKAANSGNFSLRLGNFGVDNPLEIDEFISPNIFTQFSENLFLNFNYAFAAQQSTDQDEMRILVSEDCGETWNLLKVFTSGSLRSVALPVTSDFVPSAGEWKSFSQPLVAYKNSGPILIKIQFINGGGNNFYLDDINVTASNISLEEASEIPLLEVFPNPSKGRFVINFSEKLNGRKELKLKDPKGKLLLHQQLGKDRLSYEFSDSQLPSGIYLLEVRTADHFTRRKIIIQ